MKDVNEPTDQEVQAWAEFRYQIRIWNGIAERAAREVGLAPQHQQVLLALGGFPGSEPPRIVDLAERMQLQHHSMVGLLDRMQHERLIIRETRTDGRGVSILMTEAGEQKLQAALAILRPKLRSAATELIAALSQLAGQAAGDPTTQDSQRTGNKVGARTIAR